MADGYFPTLVSRTNDANSQTNGIFTSLTDGTDLALIDASGNLQVLVNNGAGAAAVNIQDGGNSITVDGTVAISSVVPGTGATNLGKAEDAVHTSGDVGVLGLVVRRDTASSLVDTDGDYSPLQIDAAGSLRVAITSGGGGGTQFAEDAAHTSGDLGTAALVVRKDTISTNTSADGDYATILQDANGRIYTQIHDGGNSITVDAVDLDIRDLTLALDAVRISGNSTANSESNPIWVQESSALVSGEEIHNYNTAAAVASGATSNHDYTVAGTTFFLKSIVFSSSGPGKVEVQTGPVASLVTIATAFIAPFGNSVQLNFDPPREVPVTSTGTIRLIRTNRAALAQDLYSTIIGKDQ